MKIKIIASIIIVLLLVISGIMIFSLDRSDEKEKTIKEEEKEIDNRISPYTNQGITVQILRIRNRGLLEKMNTGWISFDRSWKEKPSFYYKTNVDEKESTSKGSVGVNGNVFNTWDTINMECRDKYYIEEEQEKSNIKISIVEVVKTGLFGRKTNDVVKEEINLIYDYKTGRWSGSDSYMDEDGYGHYLGEEYEVWFNIYQRDYDNDDIPYFTEVNILGTDPTQDDSKLDPDNDGVPTSWEWKWNYDPFVYDDHKNLDPDIDGIQNIEEYEMRKYFADPYQPDIYVEVDYMKKKNIFDLDHILHEESKQMVIERYSQHGINCYIDDGWPDGPINGGGEMLPFMERMPEETSGQCFRFYRHNFADERKGIFRYAYMANVMGYITPFEDNQYDIINIGTGWDQSEAYCSVKLIVPFAKRLRMHGIASGLLHELGHSLGLMPVTYYGNDIVAPVGARYPNMPKDEYQNYLDQYHSVMNYQYIYRDKTLMDYSDGSNGEPYDQNDWEYIYLPSFEIDQPSYEEPSGIDPSFEDFEVSLEYPGVILEGWTYDKNLTDKYFEEYKDIAYLKTTDNIDIQIYKKTDVHNSDEYNIKIYAKPLVNKVFSKFSLIAEGKIVEKENNIELYSFNSLKQKAFNLQNQ